MTYSAIQLSDKRWGIYYKLELLATIGCEEDCNDIIYRLNSGNNKKSRKKDSRISKTKTLVKV